MSDDRQSADIAENAGTSAIAAVAAARAALASIGTIVGESSASTPRFELFAAAKSICSQKVRAVLAHHRVPYRSHELDMFAGQTYLPEYVRLRMIGCDRMDGPLAAFHTGSTAASENGCDGAVVPTLIDLRNDEVIVDSMRICLFLDHMQDMARRLRPIQLAKQIEAQLAIIDAMPNYQLLMTRNGTGDESASQLRERASAFSLRKVEWCDSYLERYADEPVLTRAYRAKRSKERSAADRLFGPDALDKARRRTADALVQLDRLLSGRSTEWLFADAIGMADLFWAIELLRIENVGGEALWSDAGLKEISIYLDACREIPAVKTAVLDWPDALF